MLVNLDIVFFSGAKSLPHKNRTKKWERQSSYGANLYGCGKYDRFLWHLCSAMRAQCISREINWPERHSINLVNGRFGQSIFALVQKYFSNQKILR